MSVPGVDGIAADMATTMRPAQSGAPQASSASVRAAQKPPEDKTTRAALNELLNGAAPSDASIGLYSLAPDGAAIVAEQAALAADVQASVQQDSAAASAALATEPSQRRNAALADIENSLKAALVEAKQRTFAADLQDLLQAVDAGALERAAALAERIRAAEGEAGAPDLAGVAAGPPQNEAPAAHSTLAENLIAAAQAGDMTAAAVFAEAIRMQTGDAPANLPPGWLAALAGGPAGALAPLPPDLAADPLLQAFQASLIVGVRTTLNKLRRLREDRLKIPPILALEEDEKREQNRRGSGR